MRYKLSSIMLIFATMSGNHRELWFHEQGDRSWLVVTRHTVTHEIVNVDIVTWRAEVAQNDSHRLNEV